MLFVVKKYHLCLTLQAAVSVDYHLPLTLSTLEMFNSLLSMFGLQG